MPFGIVFQILTIGFWGKLGYDIFGFFGSVRGTGGLSVGLGQSALSRQTAQNEAELRGAGDLTAREGIDIIDLAKLEQRGIRDMNTIIKAMNNIIQVIKSFGGDAKDVQKISKLLEELTPPVRDVEAITRDMHNKVEELKRLEFPDSELLRRRLINIQAKKASGSNVKQIEDAVNKALEDAKREFGEIKASLEPGVNAMAQCESAFVAHFNNGMAQLREGNAGGALSYFEAAKAQAYKLASIIKALESAIKRLNNLTKQKIRDLERVRILRQAA